MLMLLILILNTAPPGPMLLPHQCTAQSPSPQCPAVVLQLACPLNFNSEDELGAITTLKLTRLSRRRCKEMAMLALPQQGVSIRLSQLQLPCLPPLQLLRSRQIHTRKIPQPPLEGLLFLRAKVVFNSL